MYENLYEYARKYELPLDWVVDGIDSAEKSGLPLDEVMADLQWEYTCKQRAQYDRDLEDYFLADMPASEVL